MRINWTGKITDEFYVLGHASVPVYLLDGQAPALFDSGFTVLAQIYENGVREVLDSKAPSYLFLTNAHWGHIGSASYLKTIWSRLQIVGSPETIDASVQSNIVERIKSLKQEAIEILSSWGITRLYEGQFEPSVFNAVVNPGQIIELGPEISVKAIPTPGHKWAFLSYYVPAL